MEQASVATFNKIKPYLDVFVPINYELSDLDFAEREINDPFVEQCIAGVDGILKPFKVVCFVALTDYVVFTNTHEL